MLLSFSAGAAAAQSAPTAPTTLAAAIHPLPAALRGGAGVVRLGPDGMPHSLRASANGMVCFSVPMDDTLYDARCYRQNFVQVVLRQIQLSAAKGRGESTRTTVEAEIRAGRIVLPSGPTAGYRCLGPRRAYLADADSVVAPIICWQSIHFPYKTARELGLIEESQLPDSTRTDMPFVMGSGTYWSHVMIMHP